MQTLPTIPLHNDRSIMIHTHPATVSLNLTATGLNLWTEFTADEARIVAARLMQAADMVLPVAVREAA